MRNFGICLRKTVLVALALLLGLTGGISGQATTPTSAQGFPMFPEPFAYGDMVSAGNGEPLAYFEIYEDNSPPEFCWWMRLWWYNSNHWSTVGPNFVVQSPATVEESVRGIAEADDVMMSWVEYDQLTSRTPAVFDPFDTSEWSLEPGSPLDPDWSFEQYGGRLVLKAGSFAPGSFAGVIRTTYQYIGPQGTGTRVAMNEMPYPVAFLMRPESPAASTRWTPAFGFCTSAPGAAPATPTSAPSTAVPPTATPSPTRTFTPTAPALPTNTPTPPPTATAVSQYYVYVLAGIGFYIGTESSVKTTQSCRFAGGGLCPNNPPTIAGVYSGPFSSVSAAKADLKTKLECQSGYWGPQGLYGGKWYWLQNNVGTSDCKSVK